MRLEQWFFQLTQRADSEALVNQHVSVAGAWGLSALLSAAALVALLLACCCLLPGLRRRRIHSVIAVLWSAGTGCGLVCVYSNPCWAALGGRATTSISYATPERVDFVLAVRFGLHGADLRLDSPTGAFHYRDQLEWPLTPRGMTELYRGALRRGLAVPLVTALEVLSKDAGPCTYGRHFRRAGYITSWLVTGALAGWAVGTLLFGTVPRLAASMMCWNGLLVVATAVTYAVLIPPHDMALRFDGVVMHVHLSWCFWLLLAVGGANVALGGWVLYKERCVPGYFASVFEVDFDYPVYRYGWPACGKAPAVPGLRRNDLRLNIDFTVNDPSSGGQTPTDERFTTPCYTIEPSQPFWTPGSIPRRPPPPPLPPGSPKASNTRPSWLYPPLQETPKPSAPPPPSPRATQSTCKRRTPRKADRRRSQSADRSVTLPLEEFVQTG